MGPCNHLTKFLTRIILFILIEQMEMKSGAQGTLDVRHNGRRHLNSLPQAHGNGGHGEHDSPTGIHSHSHSHANSHSNLPSLPHPHSQPHPDWTFTYHRVTPSKENGTTTAAAALGRKRKAIAAMSIASISTSNNKETLQDFLEAGATTTTSTTKLPEFKQWASILEKELEAAENLHWRPWIHLDEAAARALKSDSDLPRHDRRHKRRHWKRHHNQAHAARHHRHGDFG